MIWVHWVGLCSLEWKARMMNLNVELPSSSAIPLQKLWGGEFASSLKAPLYTNEMFFSIKTHGSNYTWKLHKLQPVMVYTE